ncbi:putative regulator of K+ conductance, cation/H+ exchanger, NAD(P)-binding domain superfamily [Helianthus annuus]|nr:putative regulator of K+ conductance, cation/H+ exchanger, NAD(P)-binding domain superfamily [Helianthus annuus]KAJ0499757.1 putative regulator of K+ conductance, cation/H+ exchanger, NAD(P)-binding domain superfamily [Helianthus annuus]KAJ0665834.1 putative regulator of K+ conductance, cation/H+ exchanger, NAD(P)-binding domain superfamily [Helianthus annuus]KAJ0851603.1 putative glutathione-regulated potassium-efflux system protein KefB [Helianthus annuus]
MDSCSFHTYGGEVTSCRGIKQLTVRSRFDYKLYSNTRVVLKIGSRKKLKKLLSSSCSVANSSKISGCQLKCCLWSYNKPKCTVCLLKTSRRVKVTCQGNDSVAYIDGIDKDIDVVETSNGENSSAGTDLGPEKMNISDNEKEEGESDNPSVDELRKALQMALKELEIAQLNSTMFEEKAQKVSELAIALRDEASIAQDNVDSVLNSIEKIENEEMAAKEAVQNATMALSLSEDRLKLALDSLELAKESLNPVGEIGEFEEAVVIAHEDVRDCRVTLANCQGALTQLQNKKDALQREKDVLKELADNVQKAALKAEEDVADIMLLAEEAVAFELEAAKRVNDAEIALQKAEKKHSVQPQPAVDSEDSSGDSVSEDSVEIIVETYDDASIDGSLISEDVTDNQTFEETRFSDHSDNETEIDAEKTKSQSQTKKPETQKDLTKDSSSLNSPKALLKKSSRFFSASFFSSAEDDTEFTPTSFFQSLIDSTRMQLPKLVLGALLAGAGFAFYAKRGERIRQLFQGPDIITTSIDEVSSNTKPLVKQIRKLPKKVKKLIEMLPHQEINEEEASLLDVLWLLLASVIFVPIFQKLPGGSPVLGYLTAGILIGPYGLSIIRNVHATKAIAEFGVVFLLFNIGLELSVERLSSMKKYVFGLGSAQVLSTAVVVGLVAHFVCGQLGPAAIVIGNGLALSSTAVVLQVLQERGESTSRHGRATFSVLLFQDLAVVVLLILIPLISPNSSKGGIGFQAIAEALGLAAVKALVAISAIIAGGRLLLRPIYKQIADMQNAEIFSANTLLVILGTSLLTARAGLSMALGAFLAGLLLAETEFSLQVESDIAPYRGLLLGLFFMTVGMSIDPKLLVSNFPVIMGSLGLLIVGKTALVAVVGRLFGVSWISAIRTGLLLAPGGEFAFVAFGEAVNQGIMTSQLSSLLFLVVGISMAITPWLAAGGQLIASRYEQQDVRSLLPVESETDDLQDHIIICGFGRVGQIIAQLLSERLIPFVALDVRSDRVAVGRALDLPVYFGDAGSREVLHKIGAERACAAAITLDSPGANYRTVWALSKYFPNVKTFVRAHDVDHGLNLEKAGATAVVPETLEPSLQLASAVLAQAKLPMSEIAAAINEFRSRHLSELTELCETSGSSLGYGFSRIVAKPKGQPSDSAEDNLVSEGTLAS